MIFTSYSSQVLAAKIGQWGEDELLRHILVPVDFSECAENAIRFAVAIAIRTGAELKLFHSVQVPLQTAEMTAYPISEMESEAKQKLHQIANEITQWLEKEKFRKLRVNYHVAVGFAAEEIAFSADRNNSDLIVMGTHGTGALEGLILGSNTTAVIRRVACPVMVVPEDAEFQGMDRIVYATDMQEINEKAIHMLTAFAGHFNSEIHVVHVLTSNDQLKPEQANSFKERFSQVARYPNISYHIVAAEDNSVSTVIEEYMQSNDIEVVAMITHHRTFFDKLFHPSITKRMAVHARKPLLAFH
jgi:nucleotide-binding universal stress UspA family protein